MSRAVTSEEEILKVSCGIVAKKGIAAVNMRTVASECGIALGSLYNYFSSKSEHFVCYNRGSVERYISNGKNFRKMREYCGILKPVV